MSRVAVEKDCNQNMTNVLPGKAPAGEGLIFTDGEERKDREACVSPANQSRTYEGHWLCFPQGCVREQHYRAEAPGL